MKRSTNSCREVKPGMGSKGMQLPSLGTVESAEAVATPYVAEFLQTMLANALEVMVPTRAHRAVALHSCHGSVQAGVTVQDPVGDLQAVWPHVPTPDRAKTPLALCSAMITRHRQLAKQLTPQELEQVVHDGLTTDNAQKHTITP